MGLFPFNQRSLLSRLIVVLATSRMALHAVLEIGDALLQVFRADSRLLVLMATVTSIGCVIVGMAGGARDGPLLAVIQREGMLAIERRRRPRGCAVAGGAVRAKLTRMDGWLGMT